jgi:hypothetical protein
MSNIILLAPVRENNYQFMVVLSLRGYLQLNGVTFLLEQNYIFAKIIASIL